MRKTFQKSNKLPISTKQLSSRNGLVKDKLLKLLKRANQNIQQGRFDDFSKIKKRTIYKRLKRYAQRFSLQLRWTAAGFVFMMVSSVPSFGQTFVKIEDANSPFIFYDNPLKNIKVKGESIATFGDIDNDGDLDVFVGEYSTSGNVNVYFSENIGTASNPIFADTLKNPFGLSPVEQLSYPFLLDIDDDGDLDMFVGDGDAHLNYYENIGTNLVPSFSFQGQNPFGINLPSDLSNINLAFVDIDEDGDSDLFLNSYSSQFYFFENQGTSNSPVFGNAESNPFGLYGFAYYYNSKVTFHDIDEDGDLDLFASYGQDVFYHENTGTNVAADFSTPNEYTPFGIQIDGSGDSPHFVDLDNDGHVDYFNGKTDGTFDFQKNEGATSPASFVQSQADVLGGYSAPDLVDIDNDGDMDVFVGTLYGQILFYENNGTALIPSFDIHPVSNVFGITSIGGGQMVPKLVDIDADGDFDLFVGAHFGGIYFFENVGDANNPGFVLDSDSAPFGLVDPGLRASPGFVDIDNDGDLDFFAGDFLGRIIFYENEGTSTSPEFNSHIPNAFGFSDVISTSTISFLDIDGDGDADAFVGDYGGSFSFFENIGTIDEPDFLLSSDPTPHGLTKVDGKAVVAFSDLNNDGDLDAVVGQKSGKLNYFENTTAVPVGIITILSSSKWEVFPNPANESFQVSGEAKGTVEFQLMNSLGQKVFTRKFSSGEKFELNVSGLPGGLYHLKIEDQSTSQIKSISIF